MIVVMQPGASEKSIGAVVERIKLLGLDAHLSAGEQRTIIGVVGTTPLPPPSTKCSKPMKRSSKSCG